MNEHRDDCGPPTASVLREPCVGTHHRRHLNPWSLPSSLGLRCMAVSMAGRYDNDDDRNNDNDDRDRLCCCRQRRSRRDRRHRRCDRRRRRCRRLSWGEGDLDHRNNAIGRVSTADAAAMGEAPRWQRRLWLNERQRRSQLGFVQLHTRRLYQ